MTAPPKDDGVAVVLALMAAALLSGLGIALLLVSDTERRLSSNYRDDLETRYAAAAGLERALGDLGGPADWNGILAGAVRSTFEDGTTRPTLASGQSIDLTAITTELQTAMSASAALGVNTPVWRLFSWGALADVQPAGQVRSAQYVAVWVADDLSDVDGSSSSDSNGILSLHAEAFGLAASRRAVEATIERANGLLRIVSWQED